MKLRLLALALCFGGMACGDDVDDGQPDHCGEGFLDVADASKLDASSTHDTLKVCLSGSREALSVQSRSVSGRLTVDGFADRMHVEFPSLTSVGELFLNGCHFAGVSFPALERAGTLAVSCDHEDDRAAPFIMEAPAATSVDVVRASGFHDVSLAALQTTAELTMSESESGRIATAGSAAVGGKLSLSNLNLTQAALPGIRAVDTLEIMTTHGDLGASVLPQLRTVNSLVVSNTAGLTQCSLDRLLAQLDAPPASTNIDGTVAQGPCE